jgi:hypothetical protein
MTTNTFEISLYSINDEEITLEVLAEYLPPIRGSRDRFGAPEEPDEDESWEVLDISYLGKSVTDEEIEIMTGIDSDELYELIDQKLREENN